MVGAAQLRTVVDDAEPDDVLVARLRREWEASRSSAADGDPDYRYPAHLAGPGAAAYPPPGWNPIG